MGRNLSPEYNLAALRPDLVASWSDKNEVRPNQVLPKASYVAIWVCTCGAEWSAPVRNVRTGKCKVCNFQRASKSRNFAVAYPEKLPMWSPSNEFGPEMVTPKANKKVWWICEKGHEWQAVVSSIACGTGCPYCSNQKISAENSFAAEFPDKAQYWDHKKNKGLSPDALAPGTAKRVWFICAEGHSFDSKLGNITALGRWCPYCSNHKPTNVNNLAVVAPFLASEWHQSKNKKTPNQYLPNSNAKVWWQCKEGHEWPAVIGSRFKGSGCPYCSNRRLSETNSLADKFPEVAAEYDCDANIVKDPKAILAGSHITVWWRCKYGHRWKAPINRRTSGHKSGCPECSPQSSHPEIRFFTELSALFDCVKRREKVGGIEVDIWLPRYDLSIEYDGAYYHSKLRRKDIAKNKALALSGQTVVRIREKPLKRISKNDFIIPVRPNTTKDLVDQFMEHLAALFPRLKKQVTRYKKSESFLDEKGFKELVSYLPGPGPSDSLAALNPTVAAEWNYEKNAPLKPELFHPRSGKRVWWICEKGHEWETTIDKRASGRNCPVCAGKMVHPDNCLAKLDPEIAALWYQPQNELTPNDVTLNSGRKVWFKCENGHFTFTAVASKVNSRGCQFCPGIGRNRKYIPPNFQQD